MNHIEKEKLIKADIASIENRVRHAFNQGYDLGYKEGKANCSEIPTGSPKYCDRSICLKNEYNNVGCEDCEVTKNQESSGDNVVSRDVVKEQMIMYGFHAPDMTVTEFVEDLPPVNPKEPTTKNDLGVDCISREQALVAIRNLYPGMPRVDFNGSLRKWVDKYKPYIECDDAIKQLPSVTPQEPKIVSIAEIKYDKDKLKELMNKAVLTVTPQQPKTGHWNDIPKYTDIAWECSECGRFTTLKHNYCPMCGAKMVEPQESEDKV